MNIKSSLVSSDIFIDATTLQLLKLSKQRTHHFPFSIPCSNSQRSYRFHHFWLNQYTIFQCFPPYVYYV